MKKNDMSDIFNKIFSKLSSIGVGFLVITFFVFLSIKTPYFLSGENLLSILRMASFYSIGAWGATIVLMTGGVDLSVGSNIGLTSGILFLLLMWTKNIFLALTCAIISGLIIGVINGFIIAKVKVPAFIATLSMVYILRGILYIFSNADLLMFSFGKIKVMDILGYGTLGGIQIPVIIAIIIFIILTILLKETKFGKCIVAVGSNKQAAKNVGIRIDNILILTYILSSILATLAGILMIARVSNIYPNYGEGFELEVIATALIGGASLEGGRGSLLGTAIAAILIAIVNNGIILVLNINPFWYKVVMGSIILIAVFLDKLVDIRKTKSNYKLQEKIL